ncbi:MAG: MFS transporter [Vicinamibacterales bacterium]
MATVTDDTPSRLTPLQWTICIIAAIGFLFDSYELLMMPLVVRPALVELLAVPPSSPDINRWSGLLFSLPAIAGGLFGLLGGYLTDLFGRRRVLVWSIMLYAIAAVGSGYASSVQELLFWRCCAFVGVCVEFVAAVAWLAELFPIPRQREAIIGYTQAFGSVGGILVTGVYYVIVTYADDFPVLKGGHQPWRYMLVSGLVPAIPLLLVRPFLPESTTWERARREGTLSRPSLAELFRPAYRRTTLVTTLLMACGYAVAYGAIQQTPRITPGLAEVRSLPPAQLEQAVSTVQTFHETGGLVGRLLLAMLAVRIVGRRRLLRMFQVPGLVVVPIAFFVAAVTDVTLLRVAIFSVGLCTVAQFSFWGNYLPRVFPTHLRGTGESFAANIGGRMIGTSAALMTTNLANVIGGSSAPTRLAYAAGIVATVAYVIGVVASMWLPEPASEDLPA